MEKKSQKGFKPLILRTIAILIGICYLVHPLHQQISNVLHSVSHTMALSQPILSHDYQSTGIDETHGQDGHEIASVDHHHDFLDFVGELFDTSDTSDEYPGKTQKRDTKMSKHVLARFELVLPQDVLQKNRISVQLEQELLNGYESEFYPPPKTI